MFISTQFLYTAQFGVAPWNPDGSVNPDGIPYGRPGDATIAKHLQLEDCERRTWKCRLCQKVVPKAPVECKGVEPEWWWWCDTCRARRRPVSSVQNQGLRRYMQPQHA